MIIDITKPLYEHNGGIIEINSAPGFRMHTSPSKGKSRDVATAVIDMLYPANAKSRIPITAVTGTNGKTTVVSLLSYIATQAGNTVGCTNSEGIIIGGKVICRGDCSGPKSAKVVLNDTTVNFAVLECARGGILRNGLGFDACDISILTNISDDHIDLNGITSLNDLCEVKKVVVHSTQKNGYAILNADDELVYSLKDEIECEIALFAMDKTIRIANHISQGGTACYWESGHLMLATADKVVKCGDVYSIPLTFSGHASSMMKNILPVVLASHLSDFSFDCIKSSLTNFVPDRYSLPGRMNYFEIGKASILLDYAHNTDAFIELKKYITSIDAHIKIGVVSATGDRREEDIKNIGKYSAEMFDIVIIKHDIDGRGRSNSQLTALLMEGISSTNLQPEVHVISSEEEAVMHALALSDSNTLIYYFPEHVYKGIELMDSLHALDVSRLKSYTTAEVNVDVT